MLTAKVPVRGEQRNSFQDLKARVHQRVVELLDMNAVSMMEEAVLHGELSKLIEQLLQQDSIPLNLSERTRLTKEIMHEVLGLGPIEPLLADATVADILVNGPHKVYVERFGVLEPTDVRFRDEAHLRKIIDRIVSRVGRRIDDSVPMVDARLSDGSRVNAIVPPLALDGATLSIRKFSKDPLLLDALIERRSVTPEIGAILKAIVQGRLNILISGGTGTGKTTFLNMLSSFIPPKERIITIEDAAELQLKQDHVVRLETRPANIEGKGQITQRDLVKNALRMRPDRIIVGEVRGAEAIDMLQAMNTGHDGSLTTIHANSSRDALTRLETMVAMEGLNLPTKAVRHYISSALDVIIHLSRLSDGSRKMTSIQEVSGMEGDVITLQEIFQFEQSGLDEQGKVQGKFRATGIRPKFLDRCKAAGVNVPLDVFDPRRVYQC
ncbi:MAG: Type II/IV secretion system ATP hydrolase TadA/VirB11/CpaF, TadA subfamily [Nitrospira sp.]|jgi:pilus assembly protein CpaF|nr:MAG: Type II/IV secretion system ATP hydrolase TadA/VirB11/CpaF, TadA subfamily [Nitrospira sp.]